MPRHLLTPIAAVVAAAAFAAPASAAPCPAADVLPTPANLVRARHATLCLLNQQRRLHGLRPVRANGELRHAAQRYAPAMVRHDFFSHVSPGGSTLLGRVRQTAYPLHGYTWRLGENLAWGAGSRGTPRAIVRAWMHSPGHRHNVLTARFTHIGIGITPGAPVHWSVGLPSATYATDFGTV